MLRVDQELFVQRGWIGIDQARSDRSHNRTTSSIDYEHLLSGMGEQGR